MKGELKVGKLLMFCPICGENHDVEVREGISNTIIKGVNIEYKKRYYFCCNASEDEAEFENGKLLNENLLNARNSYRIKTGLLTSDEIVSIRNSYGISQVELARLLGWGEATISRYESKAIQDDVYDKVLRIIKDNPLSTLDYLENNKDKFSDERYTELRTIILNKYEAYGKEYLSRQPLIGEYANYTVKCDENGYTILNIDKIEASISYIATRVKNLFKVKLMKMLWYADSLSFKRYGNTITGLVYEHERMGALPIGHNQIMALENVKYDEIEDPMYDVMYCFKSNEKIDMECLSKDECEVLDEIIKKFAFFSGKDIKEYMHKEIAYTNTKMYDIIPFSLAKELREFK